VRNKWEKKRKELWYNFSCCWQLQR